LFVFYIKKAHINKVLYKLILNRFEATKLVKDPFEDGLLLQLHSPLLIELVLSLSKNAIDAGSIYIC